MESRSRSKHSRTPSPASSAPRPLPADTIAHFPSSVSLDNSTGPDFSNPQLSDDIVAVLLVSYFCLCSPDPALVVAASNSANCHHQQVPGRQLLYPIFTSVIQQEPESP